MPFLKKHLMKINIPNSILCHHESLDGLKKQKKTGQIKKLLNESFI